MRCEHRQLVTMLKAAPDGADATSRVQQIKQMNSTERALAHLKNNIEGKQRQHRVLKLELERITKDLTTLGVKPEVDIEPGQLPIDEAFVEKAEAVLKKGGLKVKDLQRELGIFDVTELNRKRKALVAAGVTKETENFNGTNATFVQWIAVEPPTAETTGSTEEAK